MPLLVGVVKSGARFLPRRGQESASDFRLESSNKVNEMTTKGVVRIPSMADVARRLDGGPSMSRGGMQQQRKASRRRQPALPSSASSTRTGEARTAAERIALGAAARTVALPAALEEACDFESFVDASILATSYVDSVFACATGRPLPSGELPEGIASAEEEARLRDDMLLFAESYNQYWMRHAEEMLAENDLSADDASADRLPTDVIAMTVITLAETAALALGAFPDFERATANSFPSVRRQLLAQTPKLVCEYMPADLVRALDALCHAWQRIDVDGDVLSYVAALRLRFGMLVRCACVTPPGRTQSAANAKLLTEPLRLSDGSAAALPTLEFRQEMTHRFRALADAMWIYERHPRWTADALKADLRQHAGRRRLKIALRNGGVGGTQEIAPPMADPEAAALQVATRLRDYADIVRGGDTISEQYRNAYMEYMVGPGDEGVFRTRNPNVTASTKNVVKACRGAKFFAAASMRSTFEAEDTLTRAVARLCAAAAAASARDSVDEMNDRSRALLHEEIAALCAFHCLMKGRFNVAWRDRFTVSRTTYRTAEELGLLAADQLPVLVVTTNSYDVLYNGRMMRTTSLFESIAWWLEIVRLVHGSELPANVALFKGIVAAKMESKKRGETRQIDGCAGETVDDDEEEEEDERGEGSEFGADGERMAQLTKAMRRKATRIDLRDLCDVPTRGAAAAKLKMDHKQRCVAISENAVSF